MHIRVLGAGAGGGFPQWNCGCPNCDAVRTGSRPCRPLTQSSIAVSADGSTWVLVNASPDIRAQLAAYEEFRPTGARGTPIDSVLLTDAEVDHSYGLLLLREAGRLTIHATTASQAVLRHGTGILPALEAFADVEVRTVPLGVDTPLVGTVSYRAFEAETRKHDRFDAADGEGRVVGYRFTDAATGGVVVHLPGVQSFTDEVMAALEGADCVLVDGTCWTDDEMIGLGLASKTCRSMGHTPIDGPDGSLAVLSTLAVPTRYYIHINNTNPILIDDSPQRRALDEAGIGIAMDGTEVEV